MDFYGVVNGAYSNHHDRLGEINTRISERNIPSAMLRPAFEVRPLSSKYATLPILETRPVSTVPLQSYEQFTTESVFNPGNAKAPWGGWAERVNVETHLRNQYFALQRNDRGVYVPNSNSDLYNVTVIARDVEQPNPYLFDNGAADFSPMNPNPHNLGKLTFDNSMPDGTPRKLLDITKVNALGWHPKIKLEEGLQNTYRWFLNNPIRK